MSRNLVVGEKSSSMLTPPVITSKKSLINRDSCELHASRKMEVIMNEFKAMAAEYGSSANGTHVKGVKFDMVRQIASF